MEGKFPELASGAEPRMRQPAIQSSAQAGARSRQAPRDCLLCDVALATRMAAFAGELRRVFVIFAVGAAVFLVRHTGTSGVSAFLLISHKFVSPFGECQTAILELGCAIGS